MKINVGSIIVDHFKTLRIYPSNKVSKQDIAVFYIVPFMLAICVYSIGLSVRPDFYNVSVTFFGIFIALLLNIQVAVFGIFLRKWDSISSSSVAFGKDKLEQRKTLLSEINSNVSYLILFCCLALLFSLVSFAYTKENLFITSISSLIYSHFLLTLLMIIKRTHAVFQREYT